jgi:tetratricopeptide (TPR) repeat protein
MTAAWQQMFVEIGVRNVGHWLERSGESVNGNVEALAQHGEHLRTAVEFGFDYPPAHEDGARLALQLFTLVELRGWQREWIGLFDRALQRTADPALQFRLLIRLGQLHRTQREMARAQMCLELAQASAELQNDPHFVAVALFNLATFHFHNNEYNSAETLGQEALCCFDALDAEPRWHAATLHTLGHICSARGEYDRSLTYLRRSVAYWRQTVRTNDLARTLNTLANSLLTLQQYEDALLCYDEALAHVQATGNTLDRLYVQNSRATLFYNTGDLQAATDVFLEVQIVAARQPGFEAQEALALTNLGNVLLAQGRLDTALEKCEISVRLSRNLNDTFPLAHALSIRGEVYLEQGRYRLAWLDLNESAELMATLNDNAKAQAWRLDFIALRDQAASKMAEAGSALPTSRSGL